MRFMTRVKADENHEAGVPPVPELAAVIGQLPQAVMSARSVAGSPSRVVWAGRIVSGLTILLLLLDAYGKLAQLEPVIDGTTRLGYPLDLVFTIGAIELICVVAYLIPGSSVIGAILLTAYFGGAVATHLRLEDPLWTHVLSGVYMAVLVWAGLVMRDNRLRALILLRRTPAAA